jgi:cysteine desulfurase
MPTTKTGRINSLNMAVPRVYLDYNASAPLLPAALSATLAALEVDGNPSSVHAEGRMARRLIEAARREVAKLAGARPEHVVFTSGATEAAATLLTPDWRMGRGSLRLSRLYVTATDHPCLLNGGQFAEQAVTKIAVDGNGTIDLAALEKALAVDDRANGVPMVAVHAANNETGVVQPIHDIGRVAKSAGALLVLDAVQAAGRIPLDVSDGYADFLILSSHKIGGPKGAGAIIGYSDLVMPEPVISGGGQEKGHRAGTENLAAIAGFGAAAREAVSSLEHIETVRAKRDAMERVVVELVPDAVLFGKGADRLANTILFAIPGMKAETAQIAFDLAGVALSAGSACSSGKVGASHVLRAMGHGETTGALRVSIGHGTTESDISRFGEALAGVAARRSGRTAA